MMKFQQFFLGSLPGVVSIQFFVDIERLHQRMRHRDSPRFHRMVLVVVKLADLLVVEISHVSTVLHRNGRGLYLII